MSSTSRGGQRTEYDYYPTPEWCVFRYLEACDLPGGRWLEPCAGDGAIVRAVNTYRIEQGQTPVTCDAIDIRRSVEKDLQADAQNITVADYRTVPETTRYDVVITNPPYRSAEAFLRKAMRHADNVIFLLRLNYLGSARRHPFLSVHMPAGVYVLPNRPSFDQQGTDSIEYAWFHWQTPYYKRTESVLKLLDTTTQEERRGRRPRTPKSSPVPRSGADLQSVLARRHAEVTRVLGNSKDMA